MLTLCSLHRQSLLSLILALAGTAWAAAGRAQEPDSGRLVGGAYLDVAYLLSDNRPANHLWRSKATSPIVDRVELNNATLWAEKRPTTDSRWGFHLGLQAGEDVDNQESADAVGSADVLKHLYYTNLSYLAPVGSHELLVVGGLIPGHIGYESFQAIDNPTYTRVYGVDYVPYFEWGISAEYPYDGSVRGKLLVVNGWNYLESPNSVPSYGAQFEWDVDEASWLRGNFFYGPEQDDTALEFWRFAAEAVGQWDIGAFQLVGNLGWGTEKQAALAGNPRYDWVWGALWLMWQPEDQPWSAGVRPEFFRDEDGLQTGARQTFGAVTATLQYRMTTVRLNVLSLRAEYRFDRSTGAEGGFYKGAGNMLVPNQHLFILAVNWHVGFHKRPGRDL
jgi:hypothetical protein